MALVEPQQDQVEDGRPQANPGDQPPAPKKGKKKPGRTHHAGEEDQPVWRRRCPGRATDRFGCGCAIGIWLLIVSLAVMALSYSRVLAYEDCRNEVCATQHCWQSAVFPGTKPCVGVTATCYDNCHSPVEEAKKEQSQCLEERCAAQCPGGSVAEAACYDACSLTCLEQSHLEFALTRKAVCLERAKCTPLGEEEARMVTACKESDEPPPEVCSDPGTRIAMAVFLSLVPLLGLCCYGTYEEVYKNFKTAGGESRRKKAGHITWGLGLALAIASAIIVWVHGSNIGNFLLAPVPMFFIIFLNCCSCGCLSISRVYFGKPPKDLQRGRGRKGAAAAVDEAADAGIICDSVVEDPVKVSV